MNRFFENWFPQALPLLAPLCVHAAWPSLRFMGGGKGGRFGQGIGSSGHELASSLIRREVIMGRGLEGHELASGQSDKTGSNFPIWSCHSQVWLGT